MNQATTCPACAIVRGDRRPPGGVLLETPGFVVHGFDGQSPLAGWAVVTSRVHARAWYDAEPASLAELGPLARRVMRAQLEHLGAVHAYALALGDVLHHFHLHLVPRFADTPTHLHGRGAFEPRASDALPEARIEAAAATLATALRSASGDRR